MKIVVAPDSFKGSASSSDIAQWIENGITSVIPDCETVKIAIGDGGEGSLDAVLNNLEKDHDFLTKGGVFTEDLISTWIEWKRKNEVDYVRLRPHPAEFELYYDI